MVVSLNERKHYVAELTIAENGRSRSATHVFTSACFVAPETIHSSFRTLGLAKLNHARLEVVERTFDQAVCFFIVCQKRVPEGVLSKNGIRETEDKEAAEESPCSKPLGCLI